VNFVQFIVTIRALSDLRKKKNKFESNTVILLFVGTVALGCCIVFLISLLIKILLGARQT
jgi:hypothetical protein